MTMLSERDTGSGEWTQYWSASEAARILAPHISARQARDLIRVASLKPSGYRHSSSLRGRKSAVYPAPLLIQLFAVLEEFPPDAA